ncbi:MAG: hypothetical protein IKL24_01980 [Clostridia bacterium]|nr:hypothetical protein [Clostridia bacterium]
MKILSLIMSAVLVLSLLCGCAAQKNEADSTKEETIEENKPSLNNTGVAYKDGIVLEMYLYTLCNYFYTSHDLVSGAPEADLIHATAEFLFIQCPDKVSVSADADNVFSVSGNELLKTMKLLFGDNVSLEAYSGYLSSELYDSYDEENDTYTFTYDSDKWGAVDITPALDKPEEIEESAEGFIGILYGNNKDGTDVSIKYTFKKQVVDDYLYATLTSVEVSEK